MTARYATPAAFLSAVQSRLKEAAKTSGRPVNEIRRQYFTQRFLARVYAEERPEWILLGGSALLARIPGARHSKDIDFVHPHDLTAATTALTNMLAAASPDPFSFDIGDRVPTDDNHLTLKVTVRLGATTIDTFTIDITNRPGFAVVDTVQPQSVITIDDVDDLPPFLIAPLAQQVADKICAMYEIHHHSGIAVASSRYRDLVDLVIITTHRDTVLTADATITALIAEQQRRVITIPTDIPAPNQQWANGYHKLATRLLPRPLSRIDPALEHIRAFARPVLDGTATGTWQPSAAAWRT